MRCQVRIVALLTYYRQREPGARQPVACLLRISSSAPKAKQGLVESGFIGVTAAQLKRSSFVHARSRSPRRRRRFVYHSKGNWSHCAVASVHSTLPRMTAVIQKKDGVCMASKLAR